jgi:hypothetical protein
MATNTYVALDKVTVSGTSTATITFSSIPSTYTDLVIVGNLGSETTNAFPYLQFNGDTGSNYSYTELYGNGTNAYSVRVSNHTQLFNNDVSVKQGSVNSNVIYQIMNYSNTTTYKTSLTRQNTVDAADYNGALAAVGLWRNTAAITSVSIKLTRGGTGYNFSSGSTFSLYGIKAATALTTKATGGTIVQAADGYVYHTFTSSGTFTPTSALSADVIVVAGGGGGGHQYGGGGGAGGFLIQSGRSMSATGYTVTIGAGGSGGNSAAGSNGNNSVLDTITAIAGGGGGNAFTGTVNPNGSNGGSGGGGTKNPSTTGTAGTATQGNSGGATGYGNNGGTSSSNYSGAGGGGAGAAGASTASGGGGGNGAGGTSFTNYAIINAMGSATGTGQLSGGNYYYAAGGCGNNSVTQGLGGGGIGGYTATSAQANTGSGGGGGTDTGGPGGNGASGIVIVRYLG